jgi:hypothetical protein
MELIELNSFDFVVPTSIFNTLILSDEDCRFVIHSTFSFLYSIHYNSTKNSFVLTKRNLKIDMEFFNIISISGFIKKDLLYISLTIVQVKFIFSYLRVQVFFYIIIII